MRQLGGCFGVLLALGSMPFVIMAIADIVEGQDIGVSAAMGAFFTGTLYISSRLMKKGFGKPPPKELNPAMLEQQVLALAAGLGGRITAAECALQSGLTLEQSQNELERLRRSGACDVLVTEEGAEVYHFQGLLTARQRASAKDPLDH